MLDICGKLLERLILNRLNAHLDSVLNDKEENQFGFREGRSTMNAIGRINAVADRVAEGPVRNKGPVCSGNAGRKEYVQHSPVALL